MVIEHFTHGTDVVGKRFHERGRMLPEGVTYQTSWITADGSRCYQLMEARDAVALAEWTERWSDVVDFEIFEVKTSAEFWARR